MPYSRLELGLHAINQVLYGWLLGLWTIIMCINWIDPQIYSFCEQIKIPSNRSYFNFGTILSILAMIISSFVFLLQKTRGTFDISS